MRSDDIAVKPTKASKGTVSIQTVKGRLRLCWSCHGKRYYLSLGLPDRPTNRLAAERKAKIIELDIVSDNFDQTLAKYSPKFKAQSLSVVELFQKFTDHKAKQIYAQSLTKYRALQGYLAQFFRSKAVSQVTEDDAENFKDWLTKRLQPVTLRERLALLKSCWSWGIQKKLATENPWNFRVRVPPQQKSKPFSLREIELILQGFRTDRDYCHYADYVEFLLGTGCRIGEAIALKWKHITDDCLVVWIGEAYYRGQWKETKTGQARYVTLTTRLQHLLLNRRPDGYQPNDLVFPSPKGKPISDQNFRKRAWRSRLI